MEKSTAWTAEEITATIESYFAMLEKELEEVKYNKAQYRRELLTKLNDRKEASIEFKHCNISAILADLGLPYIKGYKPLANYQKSLKEAVLLYTTSSQPLNLTAQNSNYGNAQN